MSELLPVGTVKIIKEMTEQGDMSLRAPGQQGEE
jgi:hypothetical protein